MKKKGLFALLLILIFCVSAGTTGTVLYMKNKADTKTSDNKEAKNNKKKDKKDKDGKEEITVESPSLSAAMEGSERKYLIRASVTDVSLDYTPCVEPYSVEDDFSNVENMYQYYFNDEEKDLLKQNNFVVASANMSEFFDTYECNRYLQIPSFITTDSMMHTYHLYFAMLQKKTEKNFLYDELSVLSVQMHEKALEQLDELKDTEWEDAARRNVAYFAIANKLLGNEVQVPSTLKNVVDKELSYIQASEGIYESPLFADDQEMEDYSQYKPRGYYEGDEQLEQYFRAMMWYGRRNFAQSSELSNRCALLMNLAMVDDNKQKWEDIYSVTSFFAGNSDDLGMYEYQPIIYSVFGEDISCEKLIGNKNFDEFVDAIEKLDPPAINSCVFEDDGASTDKTLAAKGFRFMGQRFSVDEAVFTKLCYSQTLENSNGEYRMLPDALDVPAAFGSDMAMDILEENGAADFKNYKENMEMLQNKIESAPDSFWKASLYSQWMYTLKPLLTERKEGYPSYQTNDEWMKKNLECYLSSWTELKHDTVLYSKQMMAEMGGGDIEIDDRGYVETNPELFACLERLTLSTAEGLDNVGLISEEDKADLYLMSEIAGRLKDIAIKELTGDVVTGEDYEFIRCYGGNLEHFWKRTVTDNMDEYVDPAEYPAALVVDVATNPNGEVLEEAVGGASTIYVVVPVDGKLRIAEGAVYNYYQFTVPISERMTDSEWRLKIGMELTEDYQYARDDSIESPDWTKSYRYFWTYEY